MHCPEYGFNEEGKMLPPSLKEIASLKKLQQSWHQGHPVCIYVGE